MAGLRVATPVVVLEKHAAAADGWERHTLFSPEHGALAALRRHGRRPAAAEPALDLFDEAEAALESGNQGRTWFIQEARIVARHREIGRSYDALRAASTLARILARNPVAPESRPAVFRLLAEAFTAFGQEDRPDVVLFKSLYRFARDEGYPVKQEWLAGLAAADRESASQLLSRPVKEAALDAASVGHLQKRLEDYLQGGGAELRID